MNGQKSVKVYMRTDGDTINHVFNMPFDFTNYACGVAQMNGYVHIDAEGKSGGYKGPLYLCCDMCEDSYMAGNAVYSPPCRMMRRPILREIPPLVGKTGRRNFTIPQIMWLSVTSPLIQNIRLYIVDEDGNIPELDVCDLSVTLIFWRP